MYEFLLASVRNSTVAEELQQLTLSSLHRDCSSRCLAYSVFKRHIRNRCVDTRNLVSCSGAAGGDWCLYMLGSEVVAQQGQTFSDLG